MALWVVRVGYFYKATVQSDEAAIKRSPESRCIRLAFNKHGTDVEITTLNGPEAIELGKALIAAGEGNSDE